MIEKKIKAIIDNKTFTAGTKLAKIEKVLEEGEKRNELAKMLDQNQVVIKRQMQKKINARLYQHRDTEIYYVQYVLDNGAVTSEKSTRCKEFTAAYQYAVENKEQIMNSFLDRSCSNLEKIFLTYYSENSSSMIRDSATKKSLTEHQRKKYEAYMRNYAVPFFCNLKGYRTPSEVDIPDFIAFREFVMIDCDKTAKTTNNAVSALRRIWDRLYIERKVKTRIDKLPPITNTSTSVTRSCFKVDRFYNFWDKEWSNINYYMLCLVGFSTGLRNSEICYIKPKSIISVGNITYIDLVGTKTKNASRKIPVHNFVRKKIEEYIKLRGIIDDDFIFSRKDKKTALSYKIFNKAVKMCGDKIGYTEERMKEENITFYGFRHLYKTLLDSNGIRGNVSEYFMGHSNTGDVSKTYSHMDKAEMNRIARPVVDIFDAFFKNNH